MLRARPLLLAALLLAAVLALVPGAVRLPARAAPVQPDGYWLVGADGGVFTFGDARFFGSTGNLRLNQPIVATMASPTGRGYWNVARDGGVFAFGDAAFAGSTGNIRLNQPIVAAAPTRTGRGYWLIASDGGVFAFGDAGFHGSTGNIRLNRPIVAAVATPSSRGYWLIASDGGVFAFGDAVFFGSTGNIRLAQPIVAALGTPTGRGYWMVASDGGVFTFGDAVYFGSTGGQALTQPIAAAVATPSGRGYRLIGADGGVFTFGDATFRGGVSGRVAAPIVGAAMVPPTLKSESAAFYYPWYASQSVDGFWRHWDQGNKTPPADIGADFYPSLGAYSSADATVVNSHMADMAAAGITTAVISFWGRGSYEDSVLPGVVSAARAHGVRPALLIEPYAGRSTATINQDLDRVLGLGITEVWVYEAQRLNIGDWGPLLSSRREFRFWAETGNNTQVETGAFASWARGAGFQGIFTYDTLRVAPHELAAFCGSARMHGLFCSPSIAPGFQGLRATSFTTVRNRNNGAYYDGFWDAALTSAADVVSITSWNEWHEGTQLEPAKPYCTNEIGCLVNYEGAYGRTGAAAERAYVDRTRFWTDIQRSRAAAAA